MYAGKIKATKNNIYYKIAFISVVYARENWATHCHGTLPEEVEKVNQGKQSDLYYKLHGFKNHAMATSNPTVACITTSA